MKLNNIITGSLLVLLSSVAITANAKVTSPKQGVICDENVCADQNGLSKSLTANYLDQTKAKRITGSGTDITQFTLSSGVFCDADEKICYQDRYFNSEGQRGAIAKYETQRLFGSNAGKGISQTQSSSSLKSPKAGVLCDENVCADRNGLSKSLTSNYLDQSKARNITGTGTDITQFTFSDGTFCDAKAKTCYVDRYLNSNGKRSAVNREATRNLFGR